MRRRSFLQLSGGSAFAQSWKGAPVMKAGFADTDITPEIGMEQPGGYGKSFHRTLHDPCKSRAAVFDDGRNRVALVGLDALIVPRHLVVSIRRDIAATCGIPGAHVMIGASHSHSSGPIGMVQPGEFDGAPELVRKLAYEQSSMADPRYLKLVHERTVEAVRKADSGRADRMLGIGSGSEDKAAFNRRFRMRNGRTFTHPGQGNQDIVKSAGPIDPEVGVIGAWSTSGKLAGVVVNYACHATTSPGGISANWIYNLERVVRGTFGEQAVVVFLQGASGDITQVDNLNPYAQPSGEESAWVVGGRVGAEASKVLFSMARGQLAPVGALSRILEIPRRRPSRARLTEAFETVKKDPAKGEVDRTDWTFAKETVMLDYLIRKEPAVEVEVQAVQVGPAVFVSNPAEYFVDFGLEIKAKSHFKFTFPVELANGCVGYVPTEEALSPSGGGYETRLTSYSNLVPTAGREIANAGIELANRLIPGPVPVPAKAAVRNAPWSYGNVPAQPE
jgi:hypothetical protein